MSHVMADRDTGAARRRRERRMRSWWHHEQVSIAAAVAAALQASCTPVSRIRFVMFFYSLLYLAVNCSILFVPEEYLVGFFLEISSGIVAVCYTPWLANGYMFCVSS